ncbi:16S rRNA pseudouridine(516) synthase [Thalassotalea litorea]|uniref:Pseudouridine synthase n=1 Tax=Thalassotalea litorea TaxID=2020715 RepID=A0A5R9IPE0_9GAMM|nr:16S rRNA pseudouridine(516) synthase [Thalassotalea litorea]TLU67390.1 16S rRNA pseudouridine(516) synthase [Thalassotalea litorea]
MALETRRLDKFLAEHLQLNRREVRILLARRAVAVDDKPVVDRDVLVNRFSKITLDGNVLQANEPRYFMLHKPIGVVSATTDKQHKTVLDLLPVTDKPGLHITGRLDLNTSGLLLITDDSRWSEALSHPDNKVTKHYRVTLQNPIDESYIEAFANGMYFPFEDIVTQPARLKIVSDYEADVWLTEGKYHQIKRMFGRFRNPVIALHRISIGAITLDKNLEPGQSRPLNKQEIASAVPK